MKKNFLLLAFVSLAVWLPMVSSAVDDGFVSLFNGTDLSGWVPMGTNAFTVQNSAIYTNGATPYPSWLRSEKEYENFVLRFEYQTEGWYEGGFLIHAPLEGPGSKMGLKLHIRHDQETHGKRSPGALYDAAEPKSIANLPSGQWNQCEIECNWPRLRVTLNGTVIHDIDMNQDESFRYRLRKGYLGIQNIGCRISFRNLEIKPLPDQEQWNDLFAKGMDNLRFQDHADWSFRDSTLTGKGDLGNAFTRDDFEGPYELQTWVKTAVDGNGGVQFNCTEEGPGVEVQCFNCPDSTHPTGSLYGIAPANRIVSSDEQWFLLQIFVDGPNAMVRVNGEKVSETHQLKPPYRGSIGFQQHTPGATVQYKGARIKSVAWR